MLKLYSRHIELNTYIKFNVKYCLGQEVLLDFSVWSYGKTRTNFFGQPNLYIFNIYFYFNNKFNWFP